jgi:ATP-dependent helicase Lhr and Lhr-like helicase
MPTSLFHPAVSTWFNATFTAPTPAQAQAWPAIKEGTHTLIAAPTGSGKTLAAFLSAIDDLVKEGLEKGLADECYVLYVSPLKALSNDIQKNLQEPLQGIADNLLEQQQSPVDIRAAVRTGDTPQSERTKMRKTPPHILVTTPESLFILLTSDSGREMLKTVRTVIVDEIHAMAANKRGSHLSLSLERLQALSKQAITRIGLSATQEPIEEVARFLVGNREEYCNIIDSGHVRKRDLAIEIPGSPLEAVMSGEVWQELYERLEKLIEEHNTTLIFVNTRRLAERAARFLAERLGEENVTAHHGSLAREHRLNAEQRLKRGELKALVATASLELGIDIGDIDLVCQLGSPKSISSFLQRAGRAGHQVDAIPKARLFPLTRDDLLECTAILDAVRRDELDQLKVPNGHLDVLSQQIIAEVACKDCQEDELYEQIRTAYPFRDLKRENFNDVITMLAEGFSTRRGRKSRYVHYDAVNKQIKARKGAKLTAVTNGGAIPDQFDYDVIMEPEGHFIGTLNEDFAFESLPGDIFQLGNTSYRILRVEQGKVRVQDAQGQPPNIPFWFGEAPGRSDALSHAVSRLRETINDKLQHGMDAAQSWLVDEVLLDEAVASQLVAYLAATQAALGCIPTQKDIVFERFFDETGDQHLVIHSSYGSRVNRAWGLGMRKRFCKQFNFELQAAALEDSIVISLGATHSFPLEDAIHFVHSNSIKDVVTQAMLPAPMFPTHWRWNATTALAVRRNNAGKKVPPIFQRSDAEDLMAVVFPDQIACQDNLTGEREIPQHPLVDQTIDDCLNDLMDIEALTKILKKIEAKEINIHCCDLSGPSPLASEILTARPYAFLDDAPAEERRTQAVAARRFIDPTEASELGKLKPEAIKQVCIEAWPSISNADECHDALMVLGVMTDVEVKGDNPAQQDATAFMQTLLKDKRATQLTTGKQTLWVCAERLPLAQTIFSEAKLSPEIDAAGSAASKDWDKEHTLIELVRARLEGLGPIRESELATLFECTTNQIQAALLALENEGYAMRGHFTSKHEEIEWCERGLLARMHRYTMKSLRQEIQAATTAEFMRFLFNWHGMGEIRPEGSEALLNAIDRLQGFPIPAAAWERDILPTRIKGYLSNGLDQLCSSGRIIWTRLYKQNQSDHNTNKANLLRNTPVSLIDRQDVDYWHALQDKANTNNEHLSSTAKIILSTLQGKGACFFVDIVKHAGILRTQCEEALAELAANGLVTSDSYAGLRALITPTNKRPGFGRQHRRRRGTASASSIDDAGRWAIIANEDEEKEETIQAGWIKTDEESLKHIAYTLLKRYGVVFRKVLERESTLPPWRELLYVYRRMEARGEIRGGRFVEGFSGEQFALPEAVGLLRKQRNNKNTLPTTVISATDPLNLIGIILPGERIPALHTNRILFKNGLPVAKQLNSDIQYLQEVSDNQQWEINNLLTRKYNPAGFVQPKSSYSN